MTTEEVYQFIGELAICLYSKKITMSYSALNELLNDHGRNAMYGNNRAVASAISAAYRRFEAKDPVIHHAIAYTYVDKHGVPSWKNYYGE